MADRVLARRAPHIEGSAQVQDFSLIISTALEIIAGALAVGFLLSVIFGGLALPDPVASGHAYAVEAVR